jgi:hypothetical protein
MRTATEQLAQQERGHRPDAEVVIVAQKSGKQLRSRPDALDPWVGRPPLASVFETIVRAVLDLHPMQA